ncbi:MAG TPA: family 2A encapsulin nanocompartment shell protein [Anaerovoracaceae bacterium]|nr:family 2A encapsulin nanocompartment shell protein [Anaerovoracaceae bacterium]
MSEQNMAEQNSSLKNSGKTDFLTSQAAYQLAEFTKTVPQFESITPRWLSKLLEWKPLENGIFRLNKVKEEDGSPLNLLTKEMGYQYIPEGFVDYITNPREYVLNPISTIVKISTQVSDIYRKPYDQSEEQLRLSMECLRERQEFEIINSSDYGLLKNADDCQRVQTRNGYPTPDDLDELIAKVWKEPSFFLAHPKAIAAFGRECTRRGVPPATVTISGSPFITWRGIPLIPSNKLMIDGQLDPKGETGKTNILLVRTGEEKQGVIGLYQDNLPGEQSEGLSVRFMGIDNQGVGLYILLLYSSACILSGDAVGVLENVEIGHYYDYK